MARISMTDRPESAPMSLPRIFLTVLEELAERDGHRNRSAIVRKLVDREARQVLGENWQEAERLKIEIAS